MNVNPPSPWEALPPGIRRPGGVSTRVCTAANSKVVSESSVLGRGRVASLGSSLTVPSQHWAPLNTTLHGGRVTDRVPSWGPRHVGSPWGMAAGGHTGDLSELPLLPLRLRPRAWVPGPAHSQCSVITKQSHTSHKQDRTQRFHSLSRPVPGHGPPRTVKMPLPRRGARGQRGRLAPGRVEGVPAAKTDLSPRPCAHYAHRPDPRA